MSPEFDLQWLSLTIGGNDALDEAVAAERRAPEPAPQDGRFEALLASHLLWASNARMAQAPVEAGSVPTGDTVRSSRIAREVSEQLTRIAQVGVAA